MVTAVNASTNPVTPEEGKTGKVTQGKKKDTIRTPRATPARNKLLIVVENKTGLPINLNGVIIESGKSREFLKSVWNALTASFHTQALLKAGHLKVV